MSLEVLLMEDVKDLGAEGAVVKVSDGYARNYLLPRKLAAPVTAATRRQLEKLRREREAARQLAIGEARQMVVKLQKTSCTVSVKTGKDAKLFGSVTSANIAEALSAQGIEVDRHKIDLAEPIRELGVFDVKIKLHPDVEGSIKVWVVEEEGGTARA